MMEHYVGIDLGGSRTKLGLVKADGDVGFHTVIPTEPEKGPESWTNRLAATIREHISDKNVVAIGLAVPVSMDWKDMTLADCLPNLPKWEGFPIVEQLQKQLQIRVFVDIDSNAAAMAEHAVGAAKGCTDFIVVTLGTGVGSGVFSGGKLVRGARKQPIVLGHTSICHDGLQCDCGSRGCLELYVCAKAVIERAGRMSGVLVNSVEEIVKAKNDNLPWSVKVVEETGYYLGVGLANMVHSFDPEMIVLSGGLTNLGTQLRDVANRVMMSRVYSGFKPGLRVEISPLGDKLGIVGAARVARQI